MKIGFQLALMLLRDGGELLLHPSPAGSTKGFWIQNPNPATSEGMFVYTGSAPSVAVGDSVLVSAKVSDYYTLAGTTASTSNLSVAELSAPTVTTLSSGNALPAAIVLGPDTVPSTYAPNLGGGNIESTPIPPPAPRWTTTSPSRACVESTTPGWSARPTPTAVRSFARVGAPCCEPASTALRSESR